MLVDAIAHLPAGLLIIVGLHNLCGVVLEGLAVFVPRFGYLDALVGQLPMLGCVFRLNHNGTQLAARVAQALQQS